MICLTCGKELEPMPLFATVLQAYVVRERKRRTLSFRAAKRLSFKGRRMALDDYTSAETAHFHYFRANIKVPAGSSRQTKPHPRGELKDVLLLRGLSRST